LHAELIKFAQDKRR